MRNYSVIYKRKKKDNKISEKAQERRIERFTHPRFRRYRDSKGAIPLPVVVGRSFEGEEYFLCECR
jgi:hypothetical protein